MKIKTLVFLALVGLMGTTFACEHGMGKKVADSTSEMQSTSSTSAMGSGSDVGSADTTSGDDDY